jgi:hypothetical protein
MNQQHSLFDVEETIRNSKSQKASEILTPRTRKILQLLSSQGINKAVTASLLDLAGASREIVQYIAGPVVTQQNGWQQTVPSWVWRAIAVDRLDAALQEIDKGEVGKLASSSEVVALMMPIAFEVPLSSQWTDVYLCQQVESEDAEYYTNATDLTSRAVVTQSQPHQHGLEYCAARRENKLYQPLQSNLLLHHYHQNKTSQFSRFLH